ncbi:MAG: hypothetical protein ABMB14_09765 [Myxococcota bacterium]
MTRSTRSTARGWGSSSALGAVAVAAALVVVPESASAIEPSWSLGAHLGTTLVPNGYPIAFPPKIRDYDFDEDGEPDDVDGDGTPDATSLSRSYGDFLIGISGHRWVSFGGRLGLTANLDIGNRFTDVALIASYDQGIDLDTVLLLGGVGIGIASSSWRGQDTEERLRVPNYPLRLEAGVLGPINDTLAVEGLLFGQMAIPARHVYTDRSGAEVDVSGVPFTYLTLGLQVGVEFGSF